MSLNDDQAAARRGIETFDATVARVLAATKTFLHDIVAPAVGPLLRWRRRLHAVATHAVEAAGVFGDQAPKADDQIGYRVRFVEIARKAHPERSEILELAEVVDGLAAYDDNPLPHLIARAEAPTIVLPAEPAQAQVQGLIGLPIPGMGMVWQVAAIGAAAAAVAGWGAFAFEHYVELPGMQARAERNAAAADRLNDAAKANASLDARLRQREAELTAAKQSINETAERAAQQLAAAQKRWVSERAAMLDAVEQSRRAIDEARAGASSRSNDQWLRDNGLSNSHPGEGQGAGDGARTP
jgi:hypothetical protein